MRSAIVLLIAIVPWLRDGLPAADNPEEAAALAKITALGGRILRRNDRVLPKDAKADNPVVSVAFTGSEQLKDEDLQCLKPLQALIQLELGGTQVSDQGLKFLGTLKHLYMLDLRGTSVTDTGLQYLDSLQYLHMLYLDDTAVTDAGLSELRKLHKLDYLMLGQTAISDRGLRELAQIPSLTVLELSGTRVTDAGLRELSNLPRLKDIRLGRTHITDAGLKELARIPGLTTLDLTQTRITDAGLKQLGDLRALRMVLVADTKVTDAGVKELQTLLPQAQVRRQSPGQRSDPNYDVSIAHPAYTDKHPAVLFDEAHKNFHTASGRYKVFADLITNDGYRVTPNRELLTKDRLAGFNLLVSANAPGRPGKSKSAFTAAECEAVQEWVRQGGALLLITDHEPFGSGSEELGKRFGVHMSLLVSEDPANSTDGNALIFSREKKLIGDHAILRGRDASEHVNRVLTFVGQSLKGPPGSAPLLILSETAVDVSRGQQVSAAGRAQGIALKFGRGRVVVLGEAGDLSAQVYGNPPQRMGMNVPGCDNRQFALNIVHWLSGLID